MDTNVKLSIASNLFKLLNSAKSSYASLQEEDIKDGIKFYESKLSELDPINQSPARADWEYFCSVNY